MDRSDATYILEATNLSCSIAKKGDFSGKKREVFGKTAD
jgi:hypothetical protein